MVVSFGKSLLSMRKPWSSVRCQWKTLSLTSAMPSSVRLSTSTGSKWRPQSIIRPRHGKRGESRMETTGSSYSLPEGCTSCTSVCRPRMAPTTVAASRRTPVGVTESV